jgi:hypothetical protein
MKRFNGVLALMMALCMLTLPLLAQDQPGGRQRGGRGQGGPGGAGGGPGGGFGGFGRGMGTMGGGATALLGLLRMEEVRKEVNVSNETYEAVQKTQRESMANMNFREMSEEERTKAFKDMNTKAQELLDEVVEPAGQKRLMGLLLQQQGNSAVTNDVIAKELALSEDAVKGIREAVEKASEGPRSKMRDIFGGGAGGPPSEADREEMGKKMRAIGEEIRKASDEAVDGKLTADQKKAVEALKGAKFTFPENQGFGGFGGGRGGPGGGGPGGGGGRQRPGSDN